MDSRYQILLQNREKEARGTKVKRQKREGETWGSEKVFSLAKLLREGPAFGSGVNVCSFLQSFTGGQGQIISLRAEQRHFSLQSGGGSMSSEAGYYE